ncbi:MAG: HD domain-containing protein [Burkholderiaceae bacterium]|nr:HD domain-containing protein [Burkholderiaceae bacterium]
MQEQHSGLPAPDDSSTPDAERLLQVIAVTLKRQLAAPDAESLVKVAAAHNELRRLPSGLVSPARVHCLLDVAHFFYISGQTVLGLEPAANAVASARALSDLALMRRALTFQGILLADTGNIPSAIECYAEALEIAQRIEDRLGEGGVWNNLGAAFLYAAQYADSIQASKRVLELAADVPQLAAVRSLALSNIALASLHSEDFATGLDSAKESIESSGEPKTADQLLSRVNAESHYAWLLLEVNNLQSARERCEIAKRYAAQSCSQRAEQAASITEGLYEVYAGKIDIGLSRLQGALERARIMKSTLRDSLIAMVKAYDLCGKPQLALVHLRELLHVTRKSQQEKALLHHRLHLQAMGFDTQGAEIEALAAASSAPLDRAKVRSQLGLLHRQAIAAELVEDPSGQHVFRVGKLAALLGAELGLDEDTCFMLEMSARLHDIGKIGIPDAILAKRGAINPEQRALIRTHANIGAELLSQSGLPHIQMAVDVARHHHEHWDGAGYPDGIAGGAIPEAARITTLADIFDVLTHDRPYKPAWSRDKALAEIRRLKGGRFDPAMTDAFIGMVERLSREVEDLDAFLAEEAKESSFIQARQKIAAALEAARGGSAGGGSPLMKR